MDTHIKQVWRLGMETGMQKTLIWISILSGSNDFNDLAMPNMEIWMSIHTSDHIHTYPYPPIRGMVMDGAIHIWS